MNKKKVKKGHTNTQTVKALGTVNMDWVLACLAIY